MNRIRRYVHNDEIVELTPADDNRQKLEMTEITPPGGVTRSHPFIIDALMVTLAGVAAYLVARCLL